MNAYAGKYSNTPQILNFVIGIATPTVIPNLNATYTSANSITVAVAGTYEINYFSNVSVRVCSIYSSSVIVTLGSGVNAILTIKKLD